MQIAHTGSQEVDASTDKLLDVLSVGQDASQIARVHDPIFTSLDATRLSLDGYPTVMAVLAQRCGLGQVLFFFVVAHVYHDRVERQLVGHALDLLPVLCMVQVDGDGHGCRFRSHGRSMDERGSLG